MLIKPRPAPADPTKVCRTCSHHDPDLHVCCANDYAIRDEEADTMSCSDWNPKHICITCWYFDPDTNQCWFEEHDMSEEESLTRTCESWEQRKTVPLQSDGSLKMKVSETIDMTILNPESITSATSHTRHCGNCSHQRGDAICAGAHEPVNYECKNWEPRKEVPPGACCFNGEHRDKMSLQCKLKLNDAVLTVERSEHECCGFWEREQAHGVILHVVDPEEDKKQREAQVQERLIAKEKGYRRGYMVAELHMMCDAASQLLPDRKPQWERLRSILEDALKALWARNDQDKKESRL